MKWSINQKELLWMFVVGLMIWNIGLTFRTSTVTILTLDMARVIRVAAQQLSEVSEGEGLEMAKDNLAHRLRSVVQAYAIKYKTIVVDATTIIAGETHDVTEEVIKEVTR
jgi:hypothetical protein